MDITKKTFGELIDSLITTNIKCFLAQDVVANETNKDKVVAAAKTAQTTNARRNALIKAIDEYIKQDAPPLLGKTYD